MFKLTVVVLTISCSILQIFTLSSELRSSVFLHYGFENISNNTVFDDSGQDNHATMLHNVALSKNHSKCGQAMWFDNGSLKIDLKKEEMPQEESTMASFELTIAVWIWLPVKRTSYHRSIFTSFYHTVKHNQSKRLYHFGVRKNGTGLRWYVMKRDGRKLNLCQLQNNSLIEQEEWTHFAVTYSKVNHDGKLFVNGQEWKEQYNVTEGYPMPYQLGFDPIIGGFKPKKYFVGYMDDFYIFKKALNQTEILEVLHSCHSVPIINTTTTELPQETTPSTQSNTVLPTNESTPTTKWSTILPTNEPTTTATTISRKLKQSIHSHEIPGFSKADFEKFENTKNISQGKVLLKESINKITPMNRSANPSGEKAIKMTQGLEEAALILATNILKPNETVSLKTENTFLQMSIPTSGFTFPSLEQKDAQNITESLEFPNSIIGLGSVAVVCMSYSNLHNLLPQTTILSLKGSNQSLHLNSKIIGAAVNPPLTNTLEDPIAITFNHKPVRVGQQICSFWNHSVRNINGNLGQWSTKGCQLNIDKSSSTQTVCECNHLTSFALLLQSEGEPISDPPLALKIITYIGCGLSFGSCILCFIMFCSVRKKDIRHYLHINLSFALAVSQAILLFGINETKHKIVCKTLAVSLHYFYLVAFLFMLSEGVHLAVLIETAFKYGDIKLPVYLITSWGLPALIVGITFAVRFDHYGGEHACFVSAEKGTVYAFLGPFCLILVINAAILIVVLRHVIGKTSLPISSKSASKMALVRATVRSLVILFPVMGFTWIFGILFFGFRTIVFEYLFGIFCSLQGFFIFLFQYALNSENRAAFLRAFSRWRASNTSSNFSRPESGRSRQDDSLVVKARKEDDLSSQAEKCHLLVYRTVSDHNLRSTNGTLSSGV